MRFKMVDSRNQEKTNALVLPRVARSLSGYEFDPSSDEWKLDKEVTIPLDKASQLSVETGIGFRFCLMRYAEEMSSKHTSNLAYALYRYLRDTGTSEISPISLINWRAQLSKETEWRLGSLRGFLLSWHDWGFPGVSEEVVVLLKGWRIKGNEKGKAVKLGDPESGPYTDLEVSAILTWANKAFAQDEISLEAYAYLLTLLMTARRPVQVAALRGVDLKVDQSSGSRTHSIRFPRAKQRGGSFRQKFRLLPAIEDLYLVLVAQHTESVAKVCATVGSKLDVDIHGQVPVFLNERELASIHDLRDLRAALMGAAPDRLHVPTSELTRLLKFCEEACAAKSERTGKTIRLLSTRFRYTRGTKLRREGFGAEIIAELLDHSDTQQTSVYTENTADEAAIIDRHVGARLAPFAQACMGTLVNSEREAIRGDDPRSRVPNQNQEAVGTCGNYGFCVSGYRACYTCHHFQPWVDGPHESVLDELYGERRRASDAGCAREIVNANDQLILAVEHCVALCREAKAAIQMASVGDYATVWGGADE